MTDKEDYLAEITKKLESCEEQEEYCKQCLPSSYSPDFVAESFAIWRINSKRARFKPVSECKHK